MATTTLILGGGFGGISTANALRKLLPKEHRIVLIDHSPTFRIGATKTWIAIDHPGARQMDYRRDKLNDRRIEVVEDRITAIDARLRQATLAKRGKLVGDAMVIALGADLAMDSIPGLAEGAQTFYSVEGAVKLREVLAKFESGKVLFLIPKLPFKCPPAPYEAAMLVHDFLKRRGNLGKSSISVMTTEGAPMATAGPEIGQFVKELLADRGIDYSTGKKTIRVEPKTKKVVFEDGEAPYDLLIAVPPHVAPTVVRDAGLLAPSGWISVDPKTLVVAGFDQVYAIGDVTVVPLPGRFKPDVPLSMPKAGVVADAQGKVVAAQIAAKALGKPSNATFDGRAFCYMETGDMHAVRANMRFFEMPHPAMERAVPDMRQYEDKKNWVRNWVRDELGITSGRISV